MMACIVEKDVHARIFERSMVHRLELAARFQHGGLDLDDIDGGRFVVKHYRAGRDAACEADDERSIRIGSKRKR